jgi:hypothetical protein
MSRRMTAKEKEGRRLIREAFRVLPLESWERTAWWVVGKWGYTEPLSAFDLGLADERALGEDT